MRTSLTRRVKNRLALPSHLISPLRPLPLAGFLSPDGAELALPAADVSCWAMAGAFLDLPCGRFGRCCSSSSGGALRGGQHHGPFGSLPTE
jgi:hypothetical protein